MAALVLVLAVVVVYLPVWGAGFIWDDNVLITENPCIAGPLGLKEIWTTRAADICPLTLTTFWIEHALWGMRPVGYHVVNVLLHAANAVILWRVLRRLQIPGAWLGAALWALHPVMTESVAWISETKNTQSGLFYLLAVLFFLRGLDHAPGVDSRRDWNYPLLLLCGALAMASKSSTVILPLVLCLCAWWREGRLRWNCIVTLLPLFFLAALAAAATMWTQNEQGANDLPLAGTWPERLAMAGHAVCFYLGKLLWPHPLMTIYPPWPQGGWTAFFPLLLVLSALLILWLARASPLRPGFFSFAYFLVALLPVLGLVNNTFFRYSLVADHLQYLAAMGPLAWAGAVLARVSPDYPAGKAPSFPGVAFLLVLGFLTWHRTRAYESSATLWSDAVAKNPHCSIAYDNLGWLEAQKGNADAAQALYLKALKIDPESFGPHFNLGNLLFQQGRLDDAMVEYKKALEIRPHDAEAHDNLGVALLNQGQVDQAMAEYREALRLDPESFGAHYNLGNALFQIGQADEAIAQYRLAVSINPHSFVGHYNLGIVLCQNGRAGEAVAEFEEALRLEPNSIGAQVNLAKARALAPPGSQ